LFCAYRLRWHKTINSVPAVYPGVQAVEKFKFSEPQQPFHCKMTPHQFIEVGMANFIDTNINQTVLLDINFLDQLGTDNFDFYLYTLLNTDHILDEFIATYENANAGRKAYPPELLLRIIICAYYRGITSSRVIAKLCETDLKFMALAVGTKPHYTTIANFVSGNCEAIKDLFHRVLLVCDESGLIGKEHFAVDGCKLPTDASKQWSGTHSELEKKSKKMRARAQRIVDKHIDSDSSKNKESGHYKKDQQTIETLLKNANKIDTFLKENEPRIGKSKSGKEVQSNVTDNDKFIWNEFEQLQLAS
jgi:transposase